MASTPDPGARGLQAILCCGWLFSTASICLYLAALFLTTWSVATNPQDANGELGLYSFCPNTQYFVNNTMLKGLNITKVDTTCIYVDYNCRIRVGMLTDDPFGNRVYVYYSYDIFDPRPWKPQDPIYELLEVFPGKGSCTGYMNARIFGGIATASALIAWMTSPFGLCAPQRRRASGGTGTGCVCCAIICGIVSVSVWANSVLNPKTSAFGSGFWCMVSAVVIAAASVPCFSAFSSLPTSASGYQQPSAAAGEQYGYYPQYQPGQQYQYGTAPGGQTYYPQAPPATYQPQAPPASQQYRPS